MMADSHDSRLQFSRLIRWQSPSATFPERSSGGIRAEVDRDLRSAVRLSQLCTGFPHPREMRHCQTPPPRGAEIQRSGRHCGKGNSSESATHYRRGRKWDGPGLHVCGQERYQKPYQPGFSILPFRRPVNITPKRLCWSSSFRPFSCNFSDTSGSPPVRKPDD
jgi:hypothetical protein